MSTSGPGHVDPPPQPTLTDGEVSLRPWTDADIEPARLQHDDLIAHWFGFPSVVPTAADQQRAIREWHRAYAEDRRTVSFVVERAGQIAGTVEVRQLGDSVGSLSWAVFPDHRGRGIATTALRMLIDYSFRDLGLARVQADVEPGNLASLRTAGRAGLRREGLRRQAVTTRDDRRDYVLLARLATDPPPSERTGFIGVLNAALPTKRVITQGLVRSETGKVLLCELTYKREWDLPGGVVDPHESPTEALSREVQEELGLTLASRGLRLVNWLPPWRGWDDACLFVFDLGVHPEALTRGLALQPREIRAVHWCTVEEASERVAPYLADLLPRLLAEPGPASYLEGGREVIAPTADVSPRPPRDGSA